MFNRTIVGSGSNNPSVQLATKSEVKSLTLDLMQLALDLAGLVDPTPVSDASSALISLGRGQWLDAVISGVSMVPYVGDLAKAGKLPKYLKTVERAIELASKSEKLAKSLLPGFEKLKEMLNLIPDGANAYIDRMKSAVDRFLTSRHATRIANVLPDISKRFKFKPYEKNGMLYKEASGRLGVPGKVRTNRSKSAQSSVSKGTGDDAGHLIGDRFGAPGDTRNLSKQNWISNQKGTFRQLEDEWAKKLENGWGIKVEVVDITRRLDDRPFVRKVKWTEISPEGKRTTFDLDFANTHTPKSRMNQEIAVTVATPQQDNLINVDFVNKKRMD